MLIATYRKLPDPQAAIENGDVGQPLGKVEDRPVERLALGRILGGRRCRRGRGWP